MMKNLMMLPSLLLVLLSQNSEGRYTIGSTNDIASRDLASIGMMNCTNPGDIYPLQNGCNGSYMCGLNSVMYPSSCGKTRCYNNANNRCDLPKNTTSDSLFWFNCLSNDNVGKLVVWKQDPTVYGLCIHEKLVVLMNRCQGNKTFNEGRQDCV